MSYGSYQQRNAEVGESETRIAPCHLWGVVVAVEKWRAPLSTQEIWAVGE